MPPEQDYAPRPGWEMTTWHIESYNRRRWRTRSGTGGEVSLIGATRRASSEWMPGTFALAGLRTPRPNDGGATRWCVVGMWWGDDVGGDGGGGAGGGGSGGVEEDLWQYTRKVEEDPWQYARPFHDSFSTSWQEQEHSPASSLCPAASALVVQAQEAPSWPHQLPLNTLEAANPADSTASDSAATVILPAVGRHIAHPRSRHCCHYLRSE